MKKLFNLILIVFITIAGFMINLTGASAAAPDSIVMTNVVDLQTYIGTGRINLKTLSDGTVVYCMNLPLKNPKGMTLYKVGEVDAGMAYIIANGYPNKSITGDTNKDAYLTQAAVWWYLDETAGMTNLSHAFKNTYSDNHGLKQHIYALLDGAKKAKAEGYKAPSISINNVNTNLHYATKEYYESDVITVSAYNISGNYTVTTNNDKATIVDTNGNARTEFAANEGFVVRVSNEAFDENMKVSLTVEVKATGYINKAYNYKTSSGNYQPLVVAKLYPEYSEVKANITLNGSTSQIVISKQDITNKAELPGATLEVRDAEGNLIDTWVSTNEPHYIKYLKAGNYTLTETIAPEGYVLSKETITFEVKEDGSVTNVVMYNAKEEVEVPITDSNISPMVTIVGLGLIFVSLGTVVKRARA